ncbi:MAG: hypothetical protein J6J43_01100 [Oscillospiraceae bacterium]|nr:hypothetical protein [Oscillospiraceae bacterium]
MIVSEKGAVSALKKAFDKGYEIVPVGGSICIYTENWALQTNTRELPLAVSQILVEHYGGIPVEPMMVRKGKSNQHMIHGMERDRAEGLRLMQEHPVYMRRIPVTFRSKWDMFVRDTGEWMCLDRQYLDILDQTRSCAVMMTDEGMALFALGEEQLTIAPGEFGDEDHKKLCNIAEMYMKQELHEVVEPENMSLFDDMEQEE